MGIPLVRGRYFDQRDTETSAPVAIVDETLAHTYWPHQDAIGQRIKQGPPNRTRRGAWWSRGAARPLSHARIAFARGILLALSADGFALGSMSLAIHTSADPRVLANAAQKLVSALDPDQPVYRIRTMRELMAESVARRRFSMFLWPSSPERRCCWRRSASTA